MMSLTGVIQIEFRISRRRVVESSWDSIAIVNQLGPNVAFEEWRRRQRIHTSECSRFVRS